MAYINKGDMILVDGQVAIATSVDYTKLVYDAYDREMMGRSREYEGGTAVGFVQAVITSTGVRGTFRINRVKLVSHR